MLALAPAMARQDRIAAAAPDADAVEALVFDRGTTWPWRSDDPRLAQDGVIGDAAAATVEFGAAIIASIVERSRAVFDRLLDNQELMPSRAARERSE
jgi:creatinine amidohydrolase